MNGIKKAAFRREHGRQQFHYRRRGCYSNRCTEHLDARWCFANYAHVGKFAILCIALLSGIDMDTVPSKPLELGFADCQPLNI